jgi:hypothetical protein
MRDEFIAHDNSPRSTGSLALSLDSLDGNQRSTSICTNTIPPAMSRHPKRPHPRESEGFANGTQLQQKSPASESRACYKHANC